jgi:hypothetical protein
LGVLELGLEDHGDIVARLERLLTSIETLPKSHGFPHTHNHVVTLRPTLVSEADDRCREDLAGLPPDELNLFSTVDLGNFAAGLILLRQRIPELAGRASTLLNAMEWDWLYDDTVGLPYGCRAADGTPSDWWHYGWLAADSRLAHYIGIGTGKMPADSWNNLDRSLEPSWCSDLWHFEPGWDGGGLFMAYLPGIFLDEKGSELGESAFNFTQDQICYAKQIGAPAWGWSATALPTLGGGYCGYGCVNIDVLVPHASILGVEDVGPAELEENLLELEALGARPMLFDGIEMFELGFRASVNWKTGDVAPLHLLLDQSMAFLSLVNHFTNGRIRELCCQDDIMRAANILIPDYENSCSSR